MNQNFNNFKNISIEEKIGQLFFIGISGDTLNISDEKLLEEIKPGGICLFARNIKNAADTRKLLGEIREKLFFEPFLSLDQEGGLVDRLRRIVEPFPSAEEICETGNSEIISKFAAYSSEILGILGFNMNFAPVADVADQNRKNFVMSNQNRIFGKSKEEVFEFTKIYLDKLQNRGIIGCLKHFPGIGAVEFDPHEELPSVNISKEDLYQTDLFPFIKHFENSDVRAVMTGHVTFPKIDLQEIDTNGKLLPASLSHNFVTKLLREELGFQNLVLSDDLEMGAIVKNYGIGEAAKKAFLAGSDFLLICNKPEAVYEGFESILKAYKTGEISEQRIDESLERISRVRNFLKEPLEFSEQRLIELSSNIRELKESL